MIKLEITIKEENSIEIIKNISAVGTEISIKEIGKKATKHEKEVSNILKKRLKINEKFQIESNQEELKEKLKNILNSL